MPNKQQILVEETKDWEIQFEEIFWMHKKYDALTSSQSANIQNFICCLLSTQKKEILSSLKKEVWGKMVVESNCETAKRGGYCEKCFSRNAVLEEVTTLLDQYIENVK